MKENRGAEFVITQLYEKRDAIEKDMKSKLVEFSEKNPFHAIDNLTWNYESMVIGSHTWKLHELVITKWTLKALNAGADGCLTDKDYPKVYIGTHNLERDNTYLRYKTLLDAISEVIEQEMVEPLLRDRYRGSSTSPVHNAYEHFTRQALSRECDLYGFLPDAKGILENSLGSEE